MTAAPIILIVIITAAKDAFEDYKRYMTDISVNQQQTYVLRTTLQPVDDLEQERDPLMLRVLKALRHFTFEYFLYPTGLKKRHEDIEPISRKPTVLLGSDYLYHEKPLKRMSTANRNSVSNSPPAGEAFWKLKKWENVKGWFLFLIQEY